MLSLKISSPQVFADFLKKFSAVDKQLLLEISGGKLKAKTCTPEKSVVKSSSVDLKDVFSFNEADLPAEALKVGLFNIEKIVSSFKQFSWTSDTKFEVDHTTVNGEEVGTEIRIVSDDLTMNFPCATLTLFKFIITDDIIARITATDGSKYSIFVDKEKLQRVFSLCGVDSENNLLSFASSDKDVRVKGKTFNLEVAKPGFGADTTKVYKTHFAMLDKEAYQVYVMADKIIFKSTETDTVTLIGKTEE